MLHNRQSDSVAHEGAVVVQPTRLPAESYRIVVTDDDPVTRMRLEHLLSRRGYEVVLVENGREALEVVRQGHVDLLLTDIQMPGMDGLQITRLVRQLYDHAALPIIVITSSDDRQQYLDAFQSGANDYIQKPIDNDLALARIGNQLLIKTAQRELKVSEERYALAALGTNDGIWDWNLLSGELYLSPRWREMVGVSMSWNPQGREWMELIHNEDRQRVKKLLESHLCGETDCFETELRMLDQKQEYRWMLCRGVAVKDASGIACRIAGSLTDITEGKVADALTGLPSRTLFYDRVEKCVQKLSRRPECEFALIYIDVDDFKLINDHLGHDVGDAFLVEVAKRIESTLRDSDAVVARLGGDEFAVLIEGIDRPADAVRIAERIHEKMSVPYHTGDREILTRVSMGIVVAKPNDPSDFRQAPITTELLICQADAAMYRAKKQTTVAHCMFERHMLAENAMRLELAGELRHAIKRNELSLLYQPIVDMDSRNTLGFEALLRWHHPIHGDVPPGKFIEIAESNGLILDIGEWALRRACRRNMKWIQKHGTDVVISVNISIHQLVASGCLDMIKQTLAETELPPHLLRLEVTESTLMRNTDKVIGLLCKVRDLGVKIGLDDFGTGYSCLAYLHQIPMDVLKIDRSFVGNMCHSEKSMAIIRSIVALAQSLNLQIVAEGIETVRQLLELQALGCQMAQGFLLARPGPHLAAEQLIQRKWDLRGLKDVID